MASVELRKRISQKSGQLWTQVPQDLRENMKAKLLEIVSHEQVCVIGFCHTSLPHQSDSYSPPNFFVLLHRDHLSYACRPIVRHAISRVIAVIAEQELSTTRWPALLPWLNEMTSSTVTTSREVGVFVIYTCLESIMESQPAIIFEFIQHFARLLEDPQSLEVRITSLR